MALKARALGQRRGAGVLAALFLLAAACGTCGGAAAVAMKPTTVELSDAGGAGGGGAGGAGRALGTAARGSRTGSRRAGCPLDLANKLESTGKARQLVTVEAATASTSLASVALWQRPGSRSCWEPAAGPWSGFIGVNGFSDHHREGDGTTPTGFYGIGPVIYGNAPDPGTKEPYHRLVCGDWWDEDPRSPEYNTFQHVPCGQTPPFGGDSEALWTETSFYPSFAVVNYNAAPVVPYAGSGIFIHADTGDPTIGCVAIPLRDLDDLLRWLDASRSPAVVMGPAHEITRF